MIVEQLGSQEYRMRYDEKRGEFVRTSRRYLGYERGFRGVYGWIVGSGTPPERHLDVLVPTDTRYSLGDVVPVRLVGCSTACIRSSETTRRGSRSMMPSR
ncbi:MAG: hypothetical protein ACOC2D_04145 [Spirochaetota bacterium]